MGIAREEELIKLNELLVAGDIAGNLRMLTNRYPGKIVFTTSFGVEDQVITDIIFRNNIEIAVVAIDTGRLFEETLKVHSNTLKIYGKPIKVLYPERDDVEKLLSEKGPYSFYKSVENRKECCHIRKVVPLQRALEGMDVWITGIRADQSPNRTSMDAVEYDSQKDIIKYHPIFSFTLKEVEQYLKENHVPHNELHYKGYVSIGCEPCTRAVKPGEDFRAGRWWWEAQSGKECGLHEK